MARVHWHRVSSYWSLLWIFWIKWLLVLPTVGFIDPNQGYRAAGRCCPFKSSSQADWASVECETLHTALNEFFVVKDGRGCLIHMCSGLRLISMVFMAYEILLCHLHCYRITFTPKNKYSRKLLPLKALTATCFPLLGKSTSALCAAGQSSDYLVHTHDWRSCEVNCTVATDWAEKRIISICRLLSHQIDQVEERPAIDLATADTRSWISVKKTRFSGCVHNQIVSKLRIYNKRVSNHADSLLSQYVVRDAGMACGLLAIKTIRRVTTCWEGIFFCLSSSSTLTRGIWRTADAASSMETA